MRGFPFGISSTSAYAPSGNQGPQIGKGLVEVLGSICIISRCLSLLSEARKALKLSLIP